MKIALISGTMSTQLHGKFDLKGLYETRALTGSESSFFNIAKGLRELGHDVDVYCDCVEPAPAGAAKLAGARVFNVANGVSPDYDAYIASSEPDRLRGLRGLRIVQQQLNDFAYCKPDFDDYVDLYVFASEVHAQVIGLGEAKLAPSKVTWLPNSINLEFFDSRDVSRAPHSAIWCSSPDRGLHRLLEIWPAVRARVPDATLDIYYRFDPWYEQCKGLPNWAGARARFIGECLRRLGRKGENGVRVVGPLPNVEMAQRLCRAGVLPYTCEPIRFTEGFAVSVMDACAAGCVPIISDADALGSIYKDAAHVIPGKPGEHRQEWIDAIVRAMTDDAWAASVVQRTVRFAQGFGSKTVTRQWEKLIMQRAPTVVAAAENSRAHLTPGLAVRLPQLAAQGFTEQRTGAFDSRGRRHTYKYICNPMLNCHASWWSLTDEYEVQHKWWHINSGDVVIDVGAAFGSYTLPALAMGAARVIAWTPEVADVLAGNLHLNGWHERTDLFTRGLWSKPGWLAVWAWPHLVGAQFFDEKPAALPENASTMFQVTTMDEALAPLKLERLDWLKMDVEGCEIEVLRGAQQTVRRHAPKLFIENHLFRDAEMKEKFGKLLNEIRPGYVEVGTVRHYTVSHTLWTPTP